MISCWGRGLKPKDEKPACSRDKAGADSAPNLMGTGMTSEDPPTNASVEGPGVQWDTG